MAEWVKFNSKIYMPLPLAADIAIEMFVAEEVTLAFILTSEIPYFDQNLDFVKIRFLGFSFPIFHHDAERWSLHAKIGF